MKRRTFLALTLAALITGACSRKPAPRQTAGSGAATAEELFEAAKTGVIPDRFTPAERATVDKLR